MTTAFWAPNSLSSREPRAVGPDSGAGTVLALRFRGVRVKSLNRERRRMIDVSGELGDGLRQNERSCCNTLSETGRRHLRSDLETLAVFIRLYCDRKHSETDRRDMRLKTHDVEALLGAPLVLCDACARLLAHALVKRSICPMDPKPACKHCPRHCNHPAYRRRIQEVMRFSGMRLLFSGRLDYLLHLLF